ncbi:hypothetical protein CK203_013846 [Vitis vinifera]|uniref:C2 NT-type domain-containing protein n=1 Tax=Vitis vinifera TaxID=29760 RepID=A0A438JJH4_VITVI|nr:hypothetical protein CK203_013846 [Vitis vinifera]
MFKSARWRSEKSKIKAVFKLQFRATQVPQLGVEALFLSVVPADVGKPTVKLEKAWLEGGSYYWENAVYETVKFVQDPKSGKINDRIYHFIVSKGSSKAGLVGEVSIDFADYAEATKPSSVSLPLKNSNSGAVLHVSIQRIQGNVDEREVEESDDAKIKSQDKILRNQLSNGDADGSVKSNSAEDGPFNKTTSNMELSSNRRASSGSDITLSSSESSSGLDTQEKFSQDILPGERSQQAPDVAIEKLKTDFLVLARQAEMAELELQTLRKQIVKERKRGQDLSKEVGGLKEERDALKAECENLRSFQKRTDQAKIKNKLQFEGGDPRALLEELRQELSYEKDLNANLRLQLQKTQESNTELILAVRDLDEMLEQKNLEISNLSDKLATTENGEELREATSRCQSDDDEEQKALEDLVKEHNDAKEVYLLEQKVMDLYSEIEIYRRDKDELEAQMEQLALDYEILKQENHDISYRLEQSQLQDQLKMQYECSASFATMNELENQVEKLENELKKQSREFSDSLVTISELETQVRNLEEELEKQAQEFEADLEVITSAKVEQEQRAIRAEEALRKTRWQNANTAEKLQEEFKRLSKQMTSTFDANEKVAMKAMAEASELRMQNCHLEEMLQKANEDLQSIRDDYEAKLQDLCNQLNLKTSQLEQLLLETEDKSKQLKHQEKHEQEFHGVLSQEIITLMAEIERLTEENGLLSELAEQNESLRAEFQQIKMSAKKTEMLVQRGIMERSELEKTIALLRKEAEKLLEELNGMTYLKDEKETLLGNLQAELENLRARYNEMKRSLFEDETEKEKLRKQVFQLKNELKKKEDAFNTVEKKLKDSNGRGPISDGTKATPKNNKAAPVPRGSKEVASLKEKIKWLEGQIKLKETALESSTNSFLEKEKDLQNKIEELESRMEDLNQSSKSFCEYQLQKVALNGDMPGEIRSAAENLTTTALMSKENGMGMPLIESKDEILLEEQPKASAMTIREQFELDDLLMEMTSLKEKNKSMEGELKEMQERYSEISLKFAEVEGERQQLVMTVRNLKNAKKG